MAQRIAKRRLASLPLSRQTVFLTVLFLFVTLINPTVSSSSSSSDADAKEYLYNSKEDAEFVTDFHPKDEDDRPDFLYNGANQGPRVVEFYAPWCPHCQHFHSSYVQFARQIDALSSSNNDNDNSNNNNNKVKVYAVSCTKNRKICHDFNVHGYPGIKLFAAGATNATADVLYFKLHPFDVMNTLGLHHDNILNLDGGSSSSVKESDAHKKGLKGGASSTTGIVPHIPKSTTAITRTRDEIYNDAYLSFVYTLNHGVFMTNDPLNDTTKSALLNWFLLMQKALPPAWNIHNLLKDLIANIDTISDSEDALLAIVNKHSDINSNKDWSHGCSYTCGLWELFHIVTTGVVEWNLMISFGKDQIISTNQAAEALRNFIEHFFGCEHCRMHFLTAYDSCAFDRCQRLHEKASTVEEWRQLPLWLFEFHNSVNIRLLHEEGDRNADVLVTRQDELDKTWPLRGDCPVCWIADDAWDEEKVYKYMRMSYWPEDVIAVGYREELFQQQSAGSSDNFEQENVHVDLSISSYLIILIPLASIAGVALWFFMKNSARQRSGYHKRIL